MHLRRADQGLGEHCFSAGVFPLYPFFLSAGRRCRRHYQKPIRGPYLYRTTRVRVKNTFADKYGSCGAYRFRTGKFQGNRIRRPSAAPLAVRKKSKRARNV